MSNISKYLWISQTKGLRNLTKFDLLLIKKLRQPPSYFTLVAVKLLKFQKAKPGKWLDSR